MLGMYKLCVLMLGMYKLKTRMYVTCAYEKA